MEKVRMLRWSFALLVLILMYNMCHAQNSSDNSDDDLLTINQLVEEILSLDEKLQDHIEKEEARKTLINVATWKNATQISTYKDNVASRAVDSNLESNLDRKSCSHTEPFPAGSTERAWWQVDLEQLYPVYAVVITNRNIIGERLQDFDVQISESDPQFQTSALCYHFKGPLQDGVTEKFPCTDAPIPGRYVRVLNGPGMCLTLCEVQVLTK